MPDYLSKGFIDELDRELKELKKLKAEINNTLYRIRPYCDEEQSIHMRGPNRCRQRVDRPS